MSAGLQGCRTGSQNDEMAAYSGSGDGAQSWGAGAFTRLIHEKCGPLRIAIIGRAARQRTALLTYGHGDGGELIGARFFPFN